ncbi:MAG: hypothetical protein F6J87_01795 [Spirulina sp. SIO3F2]|nr:hypothetical protein [Spirulina sp. SIO3F2]
MADRYTKTETTGWFGRIGRSFVGVILGLLLFFGSFALIYINEGRTDFSKLARKSVEIALEGATEKAQGKVVSTTGAITTTETIGDNEFLKSDTYLAFWREVEMFAWEENSSSETTKNTGGSETTETTYTYSKAWSSSPENSSFFEVPDGHENPELTIEDEYGAAQQMTIGVYQLRGDRLTLPQPDAPLKPSPETIEVNDDIALDGDYLFQGAGTLSAPEIGDVRIQYYTLPSGANLTVFGQLEGNNAINPHVNRRQETFYRALDGTRQEAIAELKNEYKAALWIFRIVGFFMMWFGLMLVAEPLGVFLDFFPFVGSIFRSVSGIASFGVTFLLWSATVIISILLHNIVALIAAVIVIFGAWFGVRRLISKQDDG